MSCLVFSVPGSEAQLGRARAPSAVGALSSKPCWVCLLEIPEEHLLHNVQFHFVVLICYWPAPGQRELLADRLAGQHSMVIPAGKACQHCTGWLLRHTRSWEKGTGKCLQSVCPAPEHFV